MHAIFKYFTNCSSKHSLQWNNEIYNVYINMNIKYTGTYLSL